ncbi:MAG: FtsQ-type POTRA domain-containing protein [Prevotella sp.]|nr:FtsQ-type POTRA domain-containing protein [Prevotella sp.]
MKNRVLLTMLIIFILLAGVWITCGTIFVVRDIEIVDATATATILTDAEKNDIVTKSGLKGKNILFNLNQSKITAGVKSVNPMLKLHSVTAEFPNRVILKVSRRVPIYYDKKNQLFFDAEMCSVDGTGTDCIDITDTKIELANPLSYGDMAVGADKRAQCKIEQLKVVASYFPSLTGFDISYDDDKSVVGAERVCLMLKINAGVTFKIKTKPDDDFLHALEFTQQIYQTEKVNGVYTTTYRENEPNKVKTIIGAVEHYEK